MSTISTQIAELKAMVDRVKCKLRDERKAHEDAIAEIDEQLAELGEKPIKRTYKARTPKAAAAAPAAAAPTPADVEAPSDDSTAAALKELRAFWGILSPRQQQVVRLRVTGKMPAEIGKLIGLDKGIVSSTVFMSRKLMQEAKDKQAKAEAENAA
jgi:DNA-directed RNA polymerase specialized sigma24 family protein